MPDIFTHTDYRKFHSGYYIECKKANPVFSCQAFASRADFPNKGFIYNMIAGGKTSHNQRGWRL